MTNAAWVLPLKTRLSHMRLLYMSLLEIGEEVHFLLFVLFGFRLFVFLFGFDYLGGGAEVVGHFLRWMGYLIY